MAVVTPIDRPKSVRNRCVIEVFVAFLCCDFAFWTFLLVYGLLSENGVRSLPFSLQEISVSILLEELGLNSLPGIHTYYLTD